MLPDFQMFVPLSAFIAQIAFFGVGFLWLWSSPSRWSRSMVTAAAYPLGATMAGLVQWVSFELGVGHHAILLWTVLVLLVVLRFLLIMRRRSIEHESISGEREQQEASCGYVDSRLAWIGVVVITLAGVIGFLIAQSSDVGESDPRWQIAYRAKIVANTSGYDTPYFQHQDALHINRKYPLGFSAIGAMTMRLTGARDDAISLRAVSYAFFVSFLLLLVAYAYGYRNVTGALVSGLVVLCAPKVWALGVDENYIDFPLGVLAMTWILLLLSSVRKGVSLSLLLVAIGMIGFKMEGLLLFGCLALAVVRLGLVRGGPRLFACYFGLSAAGAVVGLVIYLIGFQQVPSGVVMDNVQYSDMALITLRDNLMRVPVIIKAFLFAHTFNVSEFGLFFPLVVVAMILAKGPFRGVVVRASCLYLILMMIPFVFSPWSSVHAHLKVTVPRILCHILPLLVLVLAEGAVQIRSFRPETAESADPA